jgi:hypothetical protein
MVSQDSIDIDDKYWPCYVWWCYFCWCFLL